MANTFNFLYENQNKIIAFGGEKFFKVILESVISLTQFYNTSLMNHEIKYEKYVQLMVDLLRRYSIPSLEDILDRGDLIPQQIEKVRRLLSRYDSLRLASHNFDRYVNSNRTLNRSKTKNLISILENEIKNIREFCIENIYHKSFPEYIQSQASSFIFIFEKLFEENLSSNKIKIK